MINYPGKNALLLMSIYVNFDFFSLTFIFDRLYYGQGSIRKYLCFHFLYKAALFLPISVLFEV